VNKCGLFSDKTQWDGFHKDSTGKIAPYFLTHQHTYEFFY